MWWLIGLGLTYEAGKAGAKKGIEEVLFTPTPTHVPALEHIDNPIIGYWFIVVFGALFIIGIIGSVLQTISEEK